MAALSVIVEEAGGRFTGLDGARGPNGGSALATNGRLHDQALAFVGVMTSPSEGGAGQRARPERAPAASGQPLTEPAAGLTCD